MNYVQVKGTMSDGKTKRDILVNSAGELMIETVKPATIKTVTVTKAIPAASAYEAEDVISESATAGLATPWEFALAKEPGGSFVIINGQINSETEDITPRITLFVYTKMPTTSLLDEALNLGPEDADKAYYVGQIDFPALSDLANTAGNPSAFISTSTVGNLPMAVTCENNNDRIYCIAVTRDVFTQTQTDNMTIRLTAIQY